MGSVYFSKRIPERTAVRRSRDRPKSFKTEEAAKTWADKQGIKKYDIENLKSPENKEKKLVVVPK